eukprot:TRINITY_DN11311_c0_g1_i1.p1 TRINITY_DN11311_c0_g1~~TRINITY_DN11311_c0_g1_i1.p1  ORF type:complete len:474 (+),score=152.92 TRINITY_DN11311_c0_g1_i1:42-1424(+)
MSAHEVRIPSVVQARLLHQMLAGYGEQAEGLLVGRVEEEEVTNDEFECLTVKVFKITNVVSLGWQNTFYNGDCELNQAVLDNTPNVVGWFRARGRSAHLPSTTELEVQHNLMQQNPDMLLCLLTSKEHQDSVTKGTLDMDTSFFHFNPSMVYTSLKMTIPNMHQSSQKEYNLFRSLEIIDGGSCDQETLDAFDGIISRKREGAARYVASIKDKVGGNRGRELSEKKQQLAELFNDYKAETRRFADLKEHRKQAMLKLKKATLDLEKLRLNHIEEGYHTGAFAIERECSLEYGRFEELFLAELSSVVKTPEESCSSPEMVDSSVTVPDAEAEEKEEAEPQVDMLCFDEVQAETRGSEECTPQVDSDASPIDHSSDAKDSIMEQFTVPQNTRERSYALPPDPQPIPPQPQALHSDTAHKRSDNSPFKELADELMRVSKPTHNAEQGAGAHDEEIEPIDPSSE